MTKINHFMKKYLSQIAIISVLFCSMAVPAVTSASYTYNGRTFATYTEYVRYVKAYMEAWRIAHGIDEDTTSRSISVIENTSVSNRVEVDTRTATDVGATSVRLVGDIDFNRSDRARPWFDYGTSKYDLSERVILNVLKKSVDGNGNFNIKAQDLDSETKYYYRAAAIDEDGNISYGSIKSFTTGIDITKSDAVIDVVTSSATNIDENRATLRATISFNKEDVAYVWFEYGDDEDDLDKDTRTVVQHEDDGRNVEITIQGLRDEEKYYFRAVAEDDYGEKTYGVTKYFTTRRDIEDEKPIVTTGSATDVEVHNATISGYVDMNDYRNGITFLIYGEDRDELNDVRYEEQYDDIRERGDDLQKVLLDDDLDKYDEYEYTLEGLDLYTTHYYAIGVEYEDSEGNDVIKLGSIRSFRTANR